VFVLKEKRHNLSGAVSRRRFLETAVGFSLCSALPVLPGAPFPVHFRKKHPYEGLFPFIEPGHDVFGVEKTAAEITSQLDNLFQKRSLPLAENFRGSSPVPIHYRTVASGIAAAEYDAADHNFGQGLTKWIDSLGTVRSARFFVLPEDRIRYEIASSGPDGL